MSLASTFARSLHRLALPGCAVLLALCGASAQAQDGSATAESRSSWSWFWSRTGAAKPAADPLPAATGPQAAAEAGAALQPGQSFRDCADCPEMVVLAGGSFMMGSDAYGEGPRRQVSVRRFALARHEVTQRQWQAVMGSNPSHFKDCGGDCPVDSVSWEAAQKFIARLNQISGKQFRLASEAEWEYACRAGAQQRHCGSDQAGEVAWNRSNSGQRTQPVGGRRANAFGLHDMSGNVSEWVQDCHESDYSHGQPVDGGAHESSDGKPCWSRVVRGGSWDGFSWATDRTGTWFDASDNTDGLRLALTLR